jgi:transcriptional regulator
LEDIAMYTPHHFQEERLEVLHRLILDQPLAALVTLGADGLSASHIPLILDHRAGSMGTLRGHLARANPQWRDFSSEVNALAIFAGPQHYISPSWYPSKREHGKVVPTWNYMVVHAYGALRIVEGREPLLRHLHELTNSQETKREQPWSVDDAPKEYVENLLRSIVGIEIEISRLEGKWKLSQNRGQADRSGVAAGLRVSGNSDARAMAETIASLPSDESVPKEGP